MFLITGATGNVGSRLTQILLDAGHDVRAFVRSPERATMLPAGVDIAVGDLDDAASVDAGVNGVSGVFHMQSSHGTEQTQTMIEAMHRADVSRIVALSSIGAVLDPPPVMGRWFQARERLLDASGLDVTHLRPNTLMPNALWWRDDILAGRAIANPTGDGRMACVDTDDIAAVAAVALTRPGHAGMGYTLTGPEALTTQQQLHILGQALGRDIEVRDATPRQVRDQSVTDGTPAAAADAMEDLNELFRADRSSVVTDDVARVTGNAPGSFAAWCARHAAAFAPATAAAR